MFKKAIGAEKKLGDPFVVAMRNSLATSSTEELEGWLSEAKRRSFEKKSNEAELLCLEGVVKMKKFSTTEEKVPPKEQGEWKSALELFRRCEKKNPIGFAYHEYVSQIQKKISS